MDMIIVVPILIALSGLTGFAMGLVVGGRRRTNIRIIRDDKTGRVKGARSSTG